jgi:L-alanine-DL-glutamate epimerase-like enolase superfamily enzyme
MVDEKTYPMFEHAIYVGCHPPEVKDGWIEVPTGVGLGLDCEWERIERNKIEEITSDNKSLKEKKP